VNRYKLHEKRAHITYPLTVGDRVKIDNDHGTIRRFFSNSMVYIKWDDWDLEEDGDVDRPYGIKELEYE